MNKHNLAENIFLDRSQKIAFARIITDLIEADFVVEVGEMDIFEELISKDAFSISDTMLIESKKMDFAKAVSILTEMDDTQCDAIVDILKQLSLSDGTCVSLEAIIIVAIEQALKFKAKVHSIPTSKVNFGSFKAIYIEDTYNVGTNRQIEENFSFITKELSQAGFEFVYIPRLINDFKQIAPGYLRKVIKYMLPSVSIERVEQFCGNLTGLTTETFSHDVIHKKLGIDILHTRPCLLIKINDSDIITPHGTEDTGRVSFSNFLQIDINDDILGVIRRFLDEYGKLINCPVVSENQSQTEKFIYKGFHRSLFDLIVYGRRLQDVRLVIDVSTQKSSVYFESLANHQERIFLKLNPQETALYYMIVKKSLDGNGLDWREHLPEKEKSELLSEYNRVYYRIGKANTTTEFKDRIQVHHIKNRIRAMQCIGNLELFLPEHIKKGNESVYRIRASRDLVRLIEITTL